GIATFLNLLALHLIRTKSRKEISQYRKLLVIFLISGFMFALLHFILQPVVLIREKAFITYGVGWSTDIRFISGYYGVASMSFLILAMHFVYRALVLSNKTNSPILITNKVLAGIILILIVELAFWTALCVTFLCYKPEYESALGSLTSDLDNFPPEEEHGFRLFMFLGFVDGHLNYSAFITIITLICLCGVSLVLIISSSVIIIRVLQNTNHRSSSWRKYNYQLFVALYLQFLGPLLVLYLPCITYLMLPFLPNNGIRSPPWLLSLCYSIYPIVIAMFLNVLALYLIRTKSRKEINQYRKLLAIFLVSGSMFAIMHFILQPVCIFRLNTFITYGVGWMAGVEFISAYYGVVSMSFLILAMHFIYRALVLS
ncbi:hypothetical protein PFISCL1PPCAC_4096, partial [Pristionchus fissidentatus]